MEAQRSGPWGLVAAGFFSLAASFSIRSSLGIMIPIWQEGLGWERGFVAGVASLALVLMALLAPIGGRLADRFGPRLLLIGGLICCALAATLIALFPYPWVFVFAFAVIGALGFSTVASHVVSTAISHAFTHKRGLALGIGTAGATAGQLLLLPVFQEGIDWVGWRWSYGGFAILTFCMALLVVFLLPGKKRKGEIAYGAPELRRELPKLLKSPIFHLLFWSFFICGFTTTGVIEIHFIPYAIACGIPAGLSTFAYGLLSGINMIGMMGAGWLTDRMEKPLLLGAIYIVRGFSFLILLNLSGSYEWLLFFAVLFGLVDYSTVPVTAGLVASRLGLRVMGLTMGLIAAGHALGAALGAYLGGYIFDLSARYDLLWAVAAGMGLVAGLMALLVGSDRRWRKKSPLVSA